MAWLEYNQNPKRNRVGGCAIRAIAKADKVWKLINELVDAVKFCILGCTRHSSTRYKIYENWAVGITPSPFSLI